MSVESPLVSVGVPVYNGGATVERSLQAIQRQTYLNLEIIIGDNASEDDTEQICRSFAEGEPGIEKDKARRHSGEKTNNPSSAE